MYMYAATTEYRISNMAQYVLAVIYMYVHMYMYMCTLPNEQWNLSNLDTFVKTDESGLICEVS